MNEEKSIYEMTTPFYIDHGELEGLTPRQVFVLGYEFCLIHGAVSDHTGAKPVNFTSTPDFTFHSDNRDRVKKMAEDCEIIFAIHEHDDWPVIEFIKRS